MEKPLTKPLRSHLDYKIAWICALDIEIAAARLMLDATHDSLPQDPTDHNNYLLGEISGHNIVITCLPFGIYGTISAACVGIQVRITYPAIRFGLMVGIGGGIPSKEADVRLGDVVVSKPSQTFGGVIQYDFGKSKVEGVFERVGSLNSPPNVVLTAVSQLRAKYLTGDGCISNTLSATFEKNPGIEQGFARPKSEDELFESTYKHSPGPTCDDCNREHLECRPARLSNDPQIHHGLVGSGNKVVKDAAERDKLADDLGIICLEMEAAGFMNQIPTQVIRGICDYADSHKNKDWQGYASLTAAAYAKELLALIPTSHTDSTVSLSHSQLISSHASSQLGRPKKKAHHVRIERRKILSRCYQFILGRISMEIYQDTSNSTTETARHVKITVLPPSWISNTAFHIEHDQFLATAHPHSAPQFCIRPVSINQNHRLRAAINNLDINELKTLFSTSQARPTDMIFDFELNEPVTLLKAAMRKNMWRLSPSRIWNHRRVLQFLLDMDQRPTEQEINLLFYFIGITVFPKGQEQYTPMALGYLQIFLHHGILSLEEVKLSFKDIPALLKYRIGDSKTGDDSHLSVISSLVEDGLGFESIRDCLFHPSQIWTIDDLGMRDIWYIGIFSNTDKAFRAALTKYLSGFQSSSFATRSDKSALSVFNMEKIVRQVKEAHISQRSKFLTTLIYYGTLEMVLPFLGIGIDLDEHRSWDNYLGEAALLGKLALVKSMLDAGASAVFAIPSLCTRANRLSESDFETVFLKLMDSIRETQTIFYPSTGIAIWDPLLAIIKCSPALRASPDSIELLFTPGMFDKALLYGYNGRLYQSYIFCSILFNRPSALKAFISHGIPLDSTLGSIFSMGVNCWEFGADYTWLTLAIELGRASCVCELIQSADGFWEPGKQREGQIYALQFSRALVAGTHPRVPRASTEYNKSWRNLEEDAPTDPISIEEDETIYRALQTAFGLACDENQIAFPDQAQLAVVDSHDKPTKPTRMSFEEFCCVVVSFLSIFTIIFGYMALNVATTLLARGQLFGRRGGLSLAALLFLTLVLCNVF